MSINARNLLQATISNTPGLAGDLVVSGPVAGHLSFVVGDNTQPFSCRFYDPSLAASEVRTGCVWTNGTSTLSRGALETSTTGAALALTSATIISVVLAASEASALGGATTLTGDVTGSGTGSFAATLATVNANVGSFGSATKASTFTVNGKGLLTAAAEVTITPAIGSVTGLGANVATALAANVGSAGAFLAPAAAPVSGGILGATSSTVPAWSIAGVAGEVVRWGGAGATPVGSGAATCSGALNVAGVLTASASIGAPSLTLSDTDTGWFRNASRQWTWSSNGSNWLTLFGGGIRTGSAIQFTNGDSTGSNDANFSRVGIGSFKFDNASTSTFTLTAAAAATLQLGPANNASPTTPQRFRSVGSRSGTDSNVPGSELRFETSDSTGNATPPAITFYSSTAAASGTGAQPKVLSFSVTNGSPVIPNSTVAGLPPAASSQYAIRIVTDALTTLALGLGTTVAGGGTNQVGVRCDGANWIYSF